MATKGIVLSQATFDYLMRAAERVYGLHGPGITNGPSGISINPPAVRQQPASGGGGRNEALFAVTVEKTGGSDGTSSTAASWTYTVRDLAGTSLGTAVAQSRPRPKGKMTFQASTTGYGVAFYDGPTLKLWDAGEVEGTGAC